MLIIHEKRKYNNNINLILQRSKKIYQKISNPKKKYHNTIANVQIFFEVKSNNQLEFF